MLGLNGLKMHYFLFGHKVNGLNLMGRLRTCCNVSLMLVVVTDVSTTFAEVIISVVSL